MVTINIEKRDFVWIGLFIILISVGFGISINSGNYQDMGHTADELNGVCLSDGTNCDVNKAYVDGAATSSDNTILDTCQICIRYADNNGRTSASWRCEDVENDLETNFVGTVNSDDDLDLRISCTDSAVQGDYQLCKRYADSNRRYLTSWTCVDFGQDLLTDFVGTVNSDDDFDLVIRPKNPGEVLTSCGLCMKHADSNTRASKPWRCATIQNPVLIDFVGSVNSDDDFDLKLSCQILFNDR